MGYNNNKTEAPCRSVEGMRNGRGQTEALLGGGPTTTTPHYSSVSVYDDTSSAHDEKDTIKDEEWEALHSENSEDALPIFTIVSILSTAFSYGCILTTLFIITLPVECDRINKEHPDIPKSVALGNFVAIAGVTQLVSPLVGRLSDTYVSPEPHQIGQRLPYLLIGSVLTVTGLLFQMAASYRNFWIRYSFAFFLHMIGLNCQ